ncbi:MAG: 23S rRNA (guanosine(2251)-2'-O)-methyltransferase RlmB [Catalinimonas sp.]
MVFGLRAVMEVLRSDQEVERLYVQKGISNDVVLPELLERARTRRVPTQRVPPEALNRMTRKNHQGVVCFVALISYASLENVIAETYAAGRDPFVLLLDRITDVRNFGAIARSAEGAGVDALVIPEKGGARIGSDALKTSAGALTHLPVCREPRLLRTVRTLQAQGIRVVACTEHAAAPLWRADLRGPLALIVGSEEDGVASELIEQCDAAGKLPMRGRIGSLNVAVAAGIAAFEVVRQREASEQ